MSNKQLTVVFHIDNCMNSHVDPKDNNYFEQWLNNMYGTHVSVRNTRAMMHDYLGMTFIFRSQEVKVDMVAYLQGMFKEFPVKFSEDNGRVSVVVGLNLFKEDHSKKLNE